MKVNKYIVSAALMAVVSIAGLSGSVHAANACTVEATKLGHWGEDLSVNGDTVTATFTVKGAAGCTTPVTVSTWKRPTIDGIKDQVLYDYQVQTFGPGVHTMTAKIPNCYYQADIYEGNGPKSLNVPDSELVKDGKWVDVGLRDFVKGGNQSCTVTPPAKTVTVTKTVVKQEAAAPAPVSSVPSTGASTASVVAGTTAISTVAGLAYNLIQKRRLLK